MRDMTVIAQALGALKALKDIGQATIGLANAAAFRERQIEFQQRIIDAQSAIFTMQTENSAALERVSELEKEVARVETWDAEKDKYELKTLGLGAFAYMLKPDARGTEEPHWVCAKCYKERRIYIIQFFEALSSSWHACPACGTHVVPRAAGLFENNRLKWLD